MEWTRELKENIAIFDPDFLKGIRPASASDILELSTVLRRSLPNKYREFLEFMGNLDGGLFYSERISTVVGDVISYCEECLEEDPEHSFDQCIPIAVGIELEGFGIIPSPEKEQQKIVFLEEGQAGEVAFPSLPAMCFGHAFMYEQCATGGWVEIRPTLESLNIDALAARLAESGYIRQWFSKERQAYFRRENRLITLVAYRQRPPLICAGGRESSMMEATVSDIDAAIGEHRSEWRKRTTLPEARQYTLDALDDIS